MRIPRRKNAWRTAGASGAPATRACAAAPPAPGTHSRATAGPARKAAVPKGPRPSSAFRMSAYLSRPHATRVEASFRAARCVTPRGPTRAPFLRLLGEEMCVLCRA